MKWRAIKFIALVALANLLFFGVIGTCLYFNPFGDAVIGVNGYVYEWVDAPLSTNSKIYIVSINDIEESNAELVKILNSVYKNSSVSPLKYASIELGRKKDVEKDGRYWFKVNADDDGKFQEGRTIAPTREEFLVKISKPGYMEVVGELENTGDSFGHGILAILVKNKN
jgi:hypothetical protein